MLALHRAGLERMLALGASAMADDALVASVLLLHGLHPLPIAERVGQALASVRPLLASHGGDVELVGLEGGVVRLRLVGSCRGCPASAQTLRHGVEAAIFELAPDVAGIEVVDALGAIAEAAPGPCVGEGKA